jgi:hypothetical protein
MKNKELEEAARRLLYNKHPYHPPQDSGYWEDMFKEGAKWQADRMYSEEEVLNLLTAFIQKYGTKYTVNINMIYEWFEQFKKK